MTASFFLTTEHLGFRTWAPEYRDLALSLWGDPAVALYINAGGPPIVAEVDKRLAREIAFQIAHGIQYWPIFRLADRAFVGCCGLRPYRLDEQIYEFGVHLLPAFWGQGLAVEAARAVIAYAFDHVGARGLFAGHHPDNEASRRMLRKLGFRYTHDEFYPPTGLDHPSYRLEPADLPICGAGATSHVKSADPP